MAYAICSSLNWPLFGIEIGEKQPVFFSNPYVKKVTSLASPIFQFFHIKGNGEDFLASQDFHHHRVIRYTIKAFFNKFEIVAKASLHLLLITDLALGTLLNVLSILDQITGNYLGDEFKQFVVSEIKISTGLLSDELCHVLRFVNKDAKISKQVIDKAEGILTARVRNFFQEKYIRMQVLHCVQNPIINMLKVRFEILKVCFCFALVLPGDLLIASFMTIFALITMGNVRWINNLAFKALKGPESTLNMIALIVPQIIVNENDQVELGRILRMFRGGNIVRIFFQNFILS